MSDYILYYYLREDLSSPYYIGYGRPRRIHAQHLRRNGANLLPPRDRRVVVQEGLTKNDAIDLEKKHIALWGREVDGGVLLNLNTGGEGKPGGQKTKGFTGGRHTQEHLEYIRDRNTGEGNPMWGRVHSEETKKNPNARTYTLTDPNGVTYMVTGRLKEFCKENGLSYATMHAAILYSRTTPRRNGWSIT